MVVLLSSTKTITAQTAVDFTLDATACQQSPVVITNITTTNSTNLVYTWSFQNSNYNNGWLGFNPPSNLMFWNGGLQTVSLNVYDTVLNVYYGATKQINIIAYPNLTSTPPNQNINLCANDSILVKYAGAINYEWWENGQIVNTSDSMWFNTTSNYLVVGTDQYGCSSTNYNSVFVETAPQISMFYQQGWNQIPLPAGNQSIDLCDQGTSFLSVSINGSWGLINWNNGYTSYTVPVDTAGSYSLTVTTNNSNNSCVYHSNTINVNLLPAPLVNIHAMTEAPYCYGAIVDLICTSIPQGTQYQWANGNQIPQNTQTISVNSSAFGAYQAYAQAPNGCWGASQTLNINFNQPVNQPYISVSPNGWQVIATSGYTTYQWYIDTNLLVGQTSQVLGITVPGFYIVEVTDQYGCSAVSNPIYVMPNTSGFVEISKSGELEIYPNPVVDNLNINMKGEVEASLYDVTGKMVASQKGDNQIVIAREGIPSGVYSLQVMNNKKVYNKKVILQ